MFTGIVQGQFPVIAIAEHPGLHSLTVALPAPLHRELNIGVSIAINGVCLTLTAVDGENAIFDIMQQTLSLTNLASLHVGDRVNVERSTRYGAEIGGHILSGHIDSLATVVSVDIPENNRFVTYQAPRELMKYIFDKGFIGLDGCSLTVAAVDARQSQFTVCFIPETLRITCHSSRNSGDTVNLEIDRQTQAIVDTVERYLSQQQASTSRE